MSQISRSNEKDKRNTRKNCPGTNLLDEAVPGLGFTGGGASFERMEE
jgi:hypothetical protein